MADQQQARSLVDFRKIFSDIQALYNSHQDDKINQYLKQGTILQKLQNALLYFKEPENLNAQGTNTSLNNLRNNQNPMKWLGKNVLNPELINILIKPLSQTINLDEIQTFEILENYFQTSPQTLGDLQYIETFLTVLQNGSQQQQMYLAQSIGINEDLRRVKKELDSVLLKVKKGAEKVYLQERRSMIDSIYIVLLVKQRHQNFEAANTLMQGGLVNNLISCLTKSNRMYEATKSMSEMQEAVRFVLREEMQINKCLFQIFRNIEMPNNSIILKYLQMQSNLRFNGNISVLGDYNYFIRRNDAMAEKDLLLHTSVLTSLAALQVHLFGQRDLSKSNEIQKYLGSLLDVQSFKQLIDFMASSQFQDSSIFCPIILVIFRQTLNLIAKLDLVKAYNLSNDKHQELTRAIQTIDQQHKKIDELDPVKTLCSILDHFSSYDIQLYNKRDECNFMVLDCINLIYPILQNHYHKAECREIALQSMKQPSFLRKIWETMPPTLGEDKIPQSGQRFRYTTIDLFEKCLQSPSMNDLNDFYLILLKLCGNKHQKYGDKLHDVLIKTKATQINLNDRLPVPKLSVFQYIVRDFDILAPQFDTLSLSKSQMHEYLLINQLLGKLVIQFFAMYEEINSEMKQVKNIYDNGSDFIDVLHGLKMRGKQSQMEFEINEPFLFLMIRNLMCLMNLSERQIPAVQKTIRVLMSAVTTVFKKINLQKEIITYLHYYRNADGTFALVYFFNYNINDVESQQGEYKFTQILLRFINCIFKTKYPQDLLSYEDRIKFLKQSLIIQLPEIVYFSLIKNFQALNYKDTFSFQSLANQIIKLSTTLLSYFQDINPYMKSPVAHYLPLFSNFLAPLTALLNACPFENVINQCLLLNKGTINGKESGVQNKLWLTELQQEKISLKTHQMTQKVIVNSLKCLNVLAELAHVLVLQRQLTPTEQNERVGTRAFYLRNLNCVDKIAQNIQTPGFGAQFIVDRRLDSSSVSNGLEQNIFSIVQYYVRPSASLNKSISSLNIEAVKFFVNCCNIWSVKTNCLPVSMESVLRQNFSSESDQRHQYIYNFKEAIMSLDIQILENLLYLNSFFDLLISCAYSQTSFLENLFRDKDFSKAMLEFIDNIKYDKITQSVRRQFLREIQVKVIVMLSMMAKRQVCYEFSKKIAEQDLVKKIYEGIVKSELIPLLNKEVKIEYKSQFCDNYVTRALDVERVSIQNVIQLQQVCFAQLGIKFFMEWISEEYAKNPDQQRIRTAITCILNNPTLIESAFSVMTSQTLEFNTLITELNTRISNSDLFAQDLANEKMRVISQTSMIGEHQSQQMMMSSLRTNDIFVQLMNLNAHQVKQHISAQTNMLADSINEYPIYQFDSRKVSQLMQLRVDVSSEGIDIRNQLSKLGNQFMINIEELIHTLKDYFFIDGESINEDQIRQIVSEYNMLQSYLASFSILQEGIQNFIVSVGMTRANLSKIKEEFITENKVLNTSLLPLVEEKDISLFVKDANAIKGARSNLVKMLVEIASNLTSILKNKNPTQYQNFSVFEHKAFDTQLDTLVLILASLNRVSQLDSLSDAENSLLEKLTPLIKALPGIRQIQLLLNQFNPKYGQALTNSLDSQNSLVYINLVLQVLQILRQVKTSNEERLKRMKGSVIPSIQEHDNDVIRVVKQVKIILAEDRFKLGEFLSQGIDILEISLEVLDNQNAQQLFLLQNGELISFLLRVFQKPISDDITYNEKAKIVEFFRKFALIDGGAQILLGLDVLQNLVSDHFMNNLKKEPFYFSEEEPIRNPNHAIWCQILLLIRIMNFHLISESRYKRNLVAQLGIYLQRLNLIADETVALKSRDYRGSETVNPRINPDNRQALSLAMLEEIELLISVCNQIFENQEIFNDDDCFFLYCQIKDRILFAILPLFSFTQNLAVKSRVESQFFKELIFDNIKGVSMIDSKSILRDSYNGFDLMADVQKINCFIEVNCTLLNLLVFDENESIRTDYINTWMNAPQSGYIFGDNVSHMSSQAETMVNKFGASKFGFDDQTMDWRINNAEVEGVDYLYLAQINILKSLRAMTDLLAFYRQNQATLPAFIQRVKGHLLNLSMFTPHKTQQISSTLATTSFADVVDLLEVALKTGFLVAIKLLKLLDFYQKEAENRVAARVSLGFNEIVDLGDDIKSAYDVLDLEIKSFAGLKGTAQDLGMDISEAIEEIKQANILRDRSEMY